MDCCNITKLRTYDCGHLSGKNGWFCGTVVDFVVDEHNVTTADVICHRPATRVNGDDSICERCVADSIQSGDYSYDEALKEFPSRSTRGM